jgi:hypothetical protein
VSATQPQVALVTGASRGLGVEIELDIDRALA